ncbi:hypothetical protein AK812_SmicGene34057 [Symbiodinium microadriaticum]|uniref:Uncharacterized protein n=1 Tax=Symbiodinium microadriaticum TaxID=2951 RepID=A0A1Q9CQ29_SYMMI|nr:hypothetical protein AK812_SmicGene34057 [Symbiodinium microadriaticum]
MTFAQLVLTSMKSLPDQVKVALTALRLQLPMPEVVNRGRPKDAKPYTTNPKPEDEELALKSSVDAYDFTAIFASYLRQYELTVDMKGMQYAGPLDEELALKSSVDAYDFTAIFASYLRQYELTVDMKGMQYAGPLDEAPLIRGSRRAAVPSVYAWYLPTPTSFEKSSCRRSDVCAMERIDESSSELSGCSGTEATLPGAGEGLSNPGFYPMESHGLNVVIPPGSLDKVVLTSAADLDNKTLKGQLNDWLKTVLDKMDGVAQTAQSEVRKACTDLLEKQQHAFSEVNHLKVEVLGTVSARATDHENEMKEIKKAMDGLACKADMKSITEKVSEIMKSLAKQADLLLEWQQPLLQALGTNQAELTAQLAGLSASQSHLWEKMTSQLGRQSAHSGELETRISRNHEDLTSRLEQHTDSFTQLQQQRDHLMQEQQRQLDRVLSTLTDRNQKLLSQLTLQLETVSTEQKQLSSDSLKQLMQQLDLLLQQFDPLTEVTQHCDQLLREQRQQLNPAMRSVQDQSQEMLMQLTTGLQGLSASSQQHQQLSVDSLKELKQHCDQVQQEQQQYLVPLTQFTQSCDQLLREQGHMLHPLMQLTQNCDQVLQQQQHRLDDLLSTIQDDRQELLTQVSSHLDKLDNLSTESKELSANSVAELKQHHSQLLLEQQQRLDPLLKNLLDQLLSQVAVQLESLSAEQKELSTDSLVQLKQQYDQLREQQQQQLHPLLSTLQDQNQELLLQLESQLDDQLDSFSAEQKRLSADSMRQLTKHWDQLQKDQRKQLDQLLKPGERSHELLTQLKTSLETLSKEQKQLRTEVLNQPTMPSMPVQQSDPGQRLQLDPVSVLQDQLAGLSGRGQRMPQTPQTPERILTPPETPSPRRLLMPQSPQQQSPTKMLQDYQDMVLLKRHEVAHAKSDQSDLVIVRRISSYYLHVMKSA